MGNATTIMPGEEESGTTIMRAGTEGAPIRAVPLRHYGRWISAAATLGVTAIVVRLFAMSPNINWPQVWNYFAAPQILDGVKLTILFTFLSMTAGLVIGVVVAGMRLSANPVLRTVSWFYVWLFRATPLLVQIIFWFNIALVLPEIGIPFTDLQIETASLVTVTVAAVLALGLNQGAYMAEIVRAGIQVVDFGQTEAGMALGMKKGLVFRKIVLPQAMRAIIPPTGNELVSMLKNTSLVSVIAAQELLTQAQGIYSRNLLTIELLIVAAIWYAIITSILTSGQYYVERYYARGSTNRDLPPTPLQRLRARLGSLARTHDAPSLGVRAQGSDAK